MKSTYIFIFFIEIVLVSCSASSSIEKSTKKKPYKECAQNYKNDYAEVTQEKYMTVFDNDTLDYTQIKFQCTSSALYNLRTMYGYYGKWNKSIIPKNRKKPLLIWENIDLFSDGNEYNIVTFGDEIARNDISTSVMIFNADGKDMLLNDDLRGKVIEFFADNIRNNRNKSKKFYHDYLKDFAPEHWKKYKTWNGIN